MGMSTHIEAFIPDTDPEYQRHKKVLMVCREEGVSLPLETAKYFDDTHASEYLLDSKLARELEKGFHYTEYSDESSQGFEVDLTKLPKGVTKLRFYNSW